MHEVFFSEDFCLHEYIYNLCNLIKLEKKTLADVLSILKDFVRTINYMFLLYRHKRFTGKYTTSKIHSRDPNGLFSIISHMSLSMT